MKNAAALKMAEEVRLQAMALMKQSMIDRGDPVSIAQYLGMCEIADGLKEIGRGLVAIAVELRHVR